MSDTEPTNTDVSATDTSASSDANPTTPDPTETVDYWKVRARDNEKRAKANADAAKRLEAIEEASKTEAQRNADKLALVERELSDARRDALRSRIASRYRIGEQDANLFLTGNDEETIIEQAKRLAEHATVVSGVQGFGIDTSGREANPPPSKDAAARAVFGI